MKTTPTSAAEALDRLRGLARAAWSRLQRDDLGDEANAAAQREYAQAREDIHDYGVSIEISEDATLAGMLMNDHTSLQARKKYTGDRAKQASLAAAGKEIDDIFDAYDV